MLVCDQVAKIVKRFTGIFWQDHEATIKRPIESIDERSMAYGSTPFQSWHEIVMHPTLQTALLKAAKAPVPPPPPPGVSLGAAEAPSACPFTKSLLACQPCCSHLRPWGPPPPPTCACVCDFLRGAGGFLVLGSSIGWFPMLAYLQFVSIYTCPQHCPL